MNEVVLSGVSHRYGKRQSLFDVALTLPPGVTGLLGPNGAGKSTLMKLLATAMPLQTGKIHFGDTSWDEDVTKVRRLLGYLPQRFELMGRGSVRHNVEYAAWAHGVDQRESVDAALAAVDLTDRAASKARSLSGGMRQRLGLACAMVHRPQLLILDEPTVGLDPTQRLGLRKTMKEAAQTSVVLLSTHLVEDLATIAEQVIVLNEGRVLFRGSLDELRDRGQGIAKEHSSPLEAGYQAVIAEAAQK